MEKKRTFILALIFFLIVAKCFAREKENVKVTVEGQKVTFHKGDWTDIQYKIPFQKVHFELWKDYEKVERMIVKTKEKIKELGSIDAYYRNIGNPSQQLLIPIICSTDYFDGNTFIITAYDEDGWLGASIYYNLVDNGIYVKDMILLVADRNIVVGKVGNETIEAHSREQFYQIGKGRFENKIFKIFFPKGTWISYRKRKKKSFSWGKDSDKICIHLPGVYEEPSLGYDLGFYKWKQQYKMFIWEK